MMSQLLYIQENGLHLVWEITKEKDVRFLHFSALPPASFREWPEKRKSKFRLVEIHFSGENQNDHHGSKHTGGMPGNRLKWVETCDGRNGWGRKLEIRQIDPVTQVVVASHFQFYDGVPIVRTWTELTHAGKHPVGLEYVSSFVLMGLDKEGLSSRDESMRLHIPHNTWYGEAQWRNYRLPELGLGTVHEFSMKRLSYGSTGTWSTSQYAPMGYLENEESGTGVVWQIEHNGSWHWEISDIAGTLYLQLSGPTEAEHHWWKNLQPGESFVSVPVAVGAAAGGFQQAIGQMTAYRRIIRRPNRDNDALPVIFNDYMNCLFGDPTEEKLKPLIDAAAEAGCEYFCVDCGWYSDGFWWDGVGEWLPSAARFPGGIGEVLEYIRRKGMIPGLWLELEVMGVQCPLADRVPDEWFFCRHGKRVIDHSRYQLDFRHPGVIAHADRVIDRLVGDYGVGYIKMDYNINAGIGTEIAADSFGDGLLQHNRAYLAWLDRVFARYPQLVIENCGSGGMRMDYALLSRHSIQSSSDQTDYRKNAVIAASAASLVAPEQCAVWSYPCKDGDREETVFNMVNSMLLRIHQSGHLAEIGPERFRLVQEGIAYYKSIRHRIARAVPFWPSGLPKLGDPWISFGLRDGDVAYLAVWRLGGESDTFRMAMPEWSGCDAAVRLGYPSQGAVEWRWHSASGTLAVSIHSRFAARLLELRRV